MAANDDGGSPRYYPSWPDYPAWVAERLVGIVAKDPTNAMVWMVNEWIKANEAGWLNDHGIRFADFVSRPRPSGPPADFQARSRDKKRKKDGEGSAKPNDESKAEGEGNGNGGT